MASDLAFFRKLFSRVARGHDRKNRPARDAAKQKNSRTFFADRRYHGSLFEEKHGVPLEKLKKDRGAYGEYLLYDLLRHEKGRWLFNLYLPHKGEYTETDLLLISPRGTFLFESKNYRGNVYGNIGGRDWFHITRTERGLRKQRFFNPLMQNGAHKSAVSRLLPFETPVFPITVFGRECTLMPELERACAGRATEFKKVKRELHKYPKCQDEKRIAEIYAVLSEFEGADSALKSAHIASVTEKNAHR